MFNTPPCQHTHTHSLSTSSSIVCACRCLCYPAVLYKTLLAADEYDVNVLQLLKNCRQQESNPGFSAFRVQWAGHAASLCPDLQLRIGPVQVLALLGPAHILTASGGQRPQWAWSNMLQVQPGVLLSFHTARRCYARAWRR